jgi:hypothetical protein
MACGWVPAASSDDFKNHLGPNTDQNNIRVSALIGARKFPDRGAYFAVLGDTMSVENIFAKLYMLPRRLLLR